MERKESSPAERSYMMFISRRFAVFFVLLLSIASATAQEPVRNVRGVRVIWPESNDKVDRRISIVGKVEFAERPADLWAAFVVILAPDNTYYFSKWEKEINSERLTVKDVDGRPVAEWKIDHIYFGEPGVEDVGKDFRFYIIILKESEIPGVVRGVCPDLKKDDKCCAGSERAFMKLERGKLAPSVWVSDPVTVRRK